ncbi:MAG: type II toxin-antitoxin system death-on-curing family toxin [Thermoanaerobaculia bacterium]|nr:type II toxin-antitoxin system death-on-curing family toxin [Thermoanaerobaculia bacterium]
MWQSLIANHPFIDGNKRTATMAADLFLLFSGLELRANDSKIEAIAMAAAKEIGFG